ncbi:MAG TPA: hypothetical protein PLP58_17305 [Prosthecobacter sp.]|nr:hypothetical protein [Prosthecobacter sp.]
MTTTLQPGRRVRLVMPRGGRLMPREAAARLLIDVARQMRMSLQVINSPLSADTQDGAVTGNLKNR